MGREVSFRGIIANEMDNIYSMICLQGLKDWILIYK